jgi:ATP-dependent DNA helicase DinG
VPLTTAELLAHDGPIAAAMRSRLGKTAHETRPEQVRMAVAVEAALESRDRLLVEAGTGVGKSFAYLVPAILRCIRRGEKVVIATSTIALQEQLISKDIPLLAATLEKWNGEQGAPNGKPDTALLPILAKGRGNYLSIRRLKLAGQRAHTILPDTESHSSLTAVEQWAYGTQDGTLSSLPILQRPEVWEHVRSDSDNCMGRKCPEYQKCFYQSARRELEKANLIVCNHALFFSDLALRTRHAIETATGESEDTPTTKPSAQIKAILPNYDHVIFDEAHGLEDAACEHFGLSLSMPRVMRLLRTLYSPKRRRGYLLERSLQISNAGVVDQALTLVQRAELACTHFFEDLLEFWRESGRGGGSAGRMRQPDLIDNPLSPVMAELAVCLRRIREGIDDENERLELGSLAKRASEIGLCAQAIVSQTLGRTERGDSMYAYWVEVEGDTPQPLQRGTRPSLAGTDEDDQAAEVAAIVASLNAPRRRFGPRVTLACAPIEIAEILRKHLFDPGAEVADAELDLGGEDESESVAPPPKKTPAPKRLGLILTSATLATKASKIGQAAAGSIDPAFNHISRNLGVAAATTLQLGSPFDYKRQAKIIIDLTVPDPKQARPTSTQHRAPSTQHHTAVLSDRILHHLRSTDAGAFVLFTSFATMYACADRLAQQFAKLRWPLFVQGRDGSRQAILQRFVAEETGILFGAASFWQGVDVRGDRLRNVIITRLPFEPPDRPLVQARTERIELTGANPFMQDSLPRAIIRFKQGFGRLIRSKADRGQVVVLDPRIVTARYGRMFIDALPQGLPMEVLKPGSGEPEEVFDEAF